MTKEEIDILTTAKDYLTGGMWNNEHSKAPVICRSDDAKNYGNLVELHYKEDLVEISGAASRAWSESWQTIYKHHEIDLDNNETFCVYILDRLVEEHTPETVEQIILSWAKKFIEDEEL